MDKAIEKIIVNLLIKAAHLWFYNRESDKATYTLEKVEVNFSVVAAHKG